LKKNYADNKSEKEEDTCSFSDRQEIPSTWPIFIVKRKKIYLNFRI